MNEFLNDVKKAIGNVDSKYFLWKDFITPDCSLYTMQERVFCYEFYHQFRMLMQNDAKYNNLIFNAEIKKSDFVFMESQGENYKYPDFVLHKGQDNTEGQELVIEVKTKFGLTPTNLEADLRKLSLFTRDTNENGLTHYNAGVFIAVNMTNDELKSNIEKILSKFSSKEVNRIYCIGTDSADFISLADLICK